MATREKRIAEFISAEVPPADLEVEVLCEDHNGTYLLPFACRRINDNWINVKTREIIDADVVGWRPW
jgi:hypothetical protein